MERKAEATLISLGQGYSLDISDPYLVKITDDRSIARSSLISLSPDKIPEIRNALTRAINNYNHRERKKNAKIERD